MEYFDVLIVGAGISGIDAACHLQKEWQKQCLDKSYVIMEARDAIGGTWDLFRYPGVRSDSDMYTLGFGFKPWNESKSIAHGDTILRYVRETAEEHGICKHIRYQHKLLAASWSTAGQRWTVTVAHGQAEIQVQCNFLLMCAGYYDYGNPHTPEIPGLHDFAGELVHPQHWPEELDYKNKHVIVVGSGATAMTLVPAIAEDAASVTMVQRSPTYVVSRPSQDYIADKLRMFLPAKLAYSITRFKNVLMQRFMYYKTRTEPEKIKRKLLSGVRHALGPGYDIATHFTPRYYPWDQRLCLIPDGDLFKAIRSGKASVVTADIARVTAQGLTLSNGEALQADILIMATGLNLRWFGGARIAVDEQPVDFSETFTYKGMMYSGIPNLIHTFGYINASWTLRADLNSEYTCRLLRRMDELGATQVTAQLRASDKDMQVRPWIADFSANYMQRSMHLFPKQGNAAPWLNTQNYAKDKKLVREKLDDGVLVFGNGEPASEPAPALARTA